MTSEEKAAGKRPSAIDSRPWPPQWLIQAIATRAATPRIVCGRIDFSAANATTNRIAAVIEVASKVRRAAEAVFRAAWTAKK
jgi:hypothetical protein